MSHCHKRLDPIKTKFFKYKHKFIKVSVNLQNALTAAEVHLVEGQ
jgi:hypothetical protein